MPWTEEQRKLFNAAAHDKEIAEQHGMTQAGARKLADEANRLSSEGKEKAVPNFIYLGDVWKD